MNLLNQIPFWKGTRLRIKNPEVSVSFYEKFFAMKNVHVLKDPENKKDVYYLGNIPESEQVEAGSEEGNQFIKSANYTLIELLHDYSVERSDDFFYNNGNVEPHRGFGHIAFFCQDLENNCIELEEQGVKFKKRPHEGRMKNLAFALDPDGYYIEIIQRDDNKDFKGLPYNLAQTMIRVKDPKSTLDFYQNGLGLKMIGSKHFEEAKFSLFFLANSIALDNNDNNNEDFFILMKTLFHPVLEITHNHGTENDDDFSYHSGNTEPVGFSNLTFLVNSIDATKETLDQNNITYDVINGESIVVKDPDNYHIVLLQHFS